MNVLGALCLRCDGAIPCRAGGAWWVCLLCSLVVVGVSLVGFVRKINVQVKALKELVRQGSLIAAERAAAAAAASAAADQPQAVGGSHTK